MYASKSSLPGDCHVANACPARSIATSPLWLKTVTCGLFLRHFVPPRRAHNDSGVKGVRLLFIMFNLIKRRIQPNSLSFRGSEKTMGILRCAPRGERLFIRLFYDVISTGVRVRPERSGEIPHGRSILFVYASKSISRWKVILSVNASKSFHRERCFVRVCVSAAGLRRTQGYR